MTLGCEEKILLSTLKKIYPFKMLDELTREMIYRDILEKINEWQEIEAKRIIDEILYGINNDEEPTGLLA